MALERPAWSDDDHPAGKSYHVDPTQILQITHDAHERGCWKKTRDGMVTPEYVAAFISDLILIEKHS